MIIRYLLFFSFVHFSLLVPGYAVVKNSKFFGKKDGLALAAAYIVSLVFLGSLATIGYALKLSPELLQFTGWAGLLTGTAVFIRQRLWHDLVSFRFPLICLFLMSLLSCVFISLTYPTKHTYIPDPEPLSGRNYEVLNVKVLNVSQTQANDNYVPYRQAQFFLNRSDPGKDCFICEWGVGFFQRTPFMGAVTAGYFNLLGDKPPVDYLWSATSNDSANTYAKFQIIAQILNALFIIPAFYLLAQFFNKKAAVISSFMLIISSFFLYNAVFSWPKSLVAFFVLVMWLLILKNRLRYTALAGIVGGIAYLTHDLAIFYIAASLLLLVFYKRWRHALIFGGISALMAVPWLVLSSIIYKKPSTFVLYPFSLHGLPQAGQGKQIIKEFLNTSPIEIISIRFDTLFYLLTPYDLIYTTGGQGFFKRLWAVGIFSIPGSLGLGLILPTILGAIKRIKKWDFWILVLIPVILSAAIVGWRGSRAIASLHFAQAVIVLLTGLGVAYLVTLKSKLWLMAAFIVNTAQLFFAILFSYAYMDASWLTSMQNLACLVVISSIAGFCGLMIYRTANNKTPGWLV